MRTIDWYGIVAWLNWPTSDGRWSLGTVVARHMAPVLWRPEATGAELQVAGTVRRIDAPSVYSHHVAKADQERYPVQALLRLDLDILAEMRGTFYPQVDFSEPSHQGLVFQNPVIIGINLGTSPAWSNLDPIVRDGSKTLLYT